MARKDNNGLISTYIKNNIKTDTLRICIANQEIKEYFEKLDIEEKTKVLKTVAGIVVDNYESCTGAPLEMFEVYDLYIDFGCLVCNYSFSIGDLSPDEIWLVQGAVKGCVYALMDMLV